ncbi:hypothetical protein R3P38DRAFT_3145020, partial [Favolaschia claudopus]
MHPFLSFWSLLAVSNLQGRADGGEGGRVKEVRGGRRAAKEAGRVCKRMGGIGRRWQSDKGLGLLGAYKGRGRTTFLFVDFIVALNPLSSKILHNISLFSYPQTQSIVILLSLSLVFLSSSFVVVVAVRR